MMSRLVPIVLDLVSGCVLSVTTLFERLGAVPYMIALGIFIAFMRFIVLPLFDHGSVVKGLRAEISDRSSHPSPSNKGTPSNGEPVKPNSD